METKDGRSCVFFAPSAGYNDYDNKYFYKMNWKENTQYTFRFYLLNDNNPQSKQALTIRYTDDTSESFGSTTTNVWQEVLFTSTANKTIKYIQVAYYSGNRYIDLDTFMVLEGAYTAQTIPSYVSHQEQTFTFPLGTQRMYLGDYLADDGVHHVRKQIEITADNVNSLVSSVGTGHDTYRAIIMKSSLGWKTSWDTGICLMNKYKEEITTANIQSGEFSLNAWNQGIEIYDDRFTDLATAKQLMIGTIIEIQQAEEWIEPYTTEQQQAYDEIKQAISYEEQTNISGESDEAKPIFTVVALKNI